MAPTVTESLFGGFTTFFSVWQLCIMQVTPFYIAYSLGAYFLLIGSGKSRGPGLKPMMLLVFCGLALGFSLVFALMGVPVLGAGNMILRNIRTLKYVAGVFILALGAVMTLSSFLTRFDFKTRLPVLFSPLVGASFAVGYSPCISPVLSRIFNYTKMQSDALHGLLLLFLYAVGMAAALTLVSCVIILLHDIRSRRAASRLSKSAPVIASLVFTVMGVLLVTGLMLRYKAMLVNLF